MEKSAKLVVQFDDDV